MKQRASFGSPTHSKNDLVLTVYSGAAMFEDFRNLVSRKDYPEYYTVIKEAMSLNTIRKRILAHKYTGWPDFEKDLNLVVTNAEEFNEEGSGIVMLARQLKVWHFPDFCRDYRPN